MRRALFLVGLLGCGGDEDSADACAGVPLVNWDNFGDAFMGESCRGCHSATSPSRVGAPEGMDFDTVDQVWAWKAAILGTAGTDAPTMPPEGGTTADDREKLHWWLECAEEGT